MKSRVIAGIGMAEPLEVRPRRTKVAKGNFEGQTDVLVIFVLPSRAFPRRGPRRFPIVLRRADPRLLAGSFADALPLAKFVKVSLGD